MISDAEIPRAITPLLQHALDIYAGETNKTSSVFRQFRPDDLAYRPHVRSMTVLEIFRHQLLSERRFFADFLQSPEPEASALFPQEAVPDAFAARLEDLARPRLAFLAAQAEAWWLEMRPFFDVERQRVWILWRRILHSAHHRTQLTTYLRMLDRTVVSTYGPTADVTWEGASPTLR